jgi:signal peptidase I
MKKAVIVLSATGGILVVLWILLRLTHILEMYHIPTTANQPAYKPGDILFASRLKTINNNDFVVFKGPDKSPWIFRCIGKEGDVIEIKNASVYLNGKLLNEPFAWNEYYISKNQLQSIAGYVNKDKKTINPVNDSLFSVNFTTAELQDLHLNLKHRIAKDTMNSNLFPAFKKTGYTEDNLGPVKIPANSYFLLGDNRHDAFDSRYFGFLNKEDVISTVIR